MPYHGFVLAALLGYFALTLKDLSVAALPKLNMLLSKNRLTTPNPD